MTDHSKALEFRTSCAEFQEQLPELFESGSVVSDHSHLQSCKNCRSLVRDLEYIAEQARDLMAPVDPGDGVWQNIQSAIREEAGATEIHSRIKSS